ncbi:MAG: hypothetical protein JO079_12370, partial [Frankiaceae bacterium]|nr:hypothetical protein [Frankiaceae bacterium]
QHVTTVCNGTQTVIQGEMDVRCEPWDGSAWTGSAWTGSAWTGSAWTSAEYDDFMTAFWGNKTPWWKRLPGEIRSPRPGLKQAV